jgi:mono/diheme cytochrome c family protein
MKRSVGALVALLVWLPCAAAQQSGENLNAVETQGRQLFAQSCGVCHLQPVLGSATYGPLLNKATAAGNQEAMRIIIANGTERMPGFKHYLKAAEVDAIIAYVRTLPPPATPDAKGGSR